MKRHALFVIFFILILTPGISLASSLSINPPSGTFEVGSTFDVSILLDTKGRSINAIQVFLTFPPDKLQVVSPSTGASIVNVWTVPPKFNNVAGTVSLEGGIPGGIIVSNGTLNTLRFRVKSTGEALIKFLSRSRIFLNDGLATDDLSQSQNAVYQFKLPPPEGPVVTSETHSNQSTWYPNGNAVLRFDSGASGVESFSYVLNDDPVTVPDNISEGIKRAVTYNNLSDGVHYFHIKAFRDGIWGGTTHFTIKVDTTPPADFPMKISPSARTTNTRPIIQFTTTDAHSGLDHYEIKLEPISSETIQTYSDDVNFFIEITSPFISSTLALGSYDVFIRAYDKADNYKEISQRLVITTPIFTVIGSQGLIIRNSLTISWRLVWVIGFLLLFILGSAAYQVWKWCYIVYTIQKEKKLPEDVMSKLKELREYQKKYGGKALMILFIVMSLMSFNGTAYAEVLEFPPPIINTISKDISNKDIFYVGGRTDLVNGTIVIYLQNLSTGETISENILPDKYGDWFYRHNVFLPPGDYLLWTQSKSGEKLSPPGPQTTMTVKRTAIEFGSNRLSYEMIYLFMVIILLFGIGGLIIFIIFHTYHGRKKYKEFREEVKRAEESIHIGFEVLQRDIVAELTMLHKARSNQTFSDEEKAKEAELLRDLDDVSKRIGREIEYIEKIEEK